MDGGIFQSGTSFTNVINGNHRITVRNSSGCITEGALFLVSCGCANPPVIVPGSQAGTICGTSMITVSGNTFGGSTTAVSITTNGGGIVSPATATVSPFTYTYTPAESDKGNIVTITLTGNNPLGFPCVAPSATYNLTVNATPEIPVPGTITQMTCTVQTGSIILNGLPSSGTWTLTRSPGLIITTGTGTSTTIQGLAAGTYTFTVTGSTGCTSGVSSGIVITPHPGNPGAPVVGTITQPSCNMPTSSVVLSGLPATGSWTLIRNPGSITFTGSGTSTIISGLSPGSYSYTVTNSAGCISVQSQNIIITAQPGTAIVVITDPAPLCAPGKADLRLPAVTAGSSAGLAFTYWTDSFATTSYTTPSAADAGTYYIKGLTSAGCFDIKPVTVRVNTRPVADAGKDKILINQFNVTMDARLSGVNETGVWSLISGTGELLDKNNPVTPVSRLSLNENIFLWTVTNGVCPVSSDTVKIIVRDPAIQTLITPNMDGKNDYLLVKGLSSFGKTGLMVFDRRGARVFNSSNYDNLWNGIDHNGNPLQDDTYFYVLKPEKGTSITGFIVIRR
jgi:gliding motility-associated-like protein